MGGDRGGTVEGALAGTGRGTGEGAWVGAFKKKKIWNDIIVFLRNDDISGFVVVQYSRNLCVIHSLFKCEATSA